MLDPSSAPRGLVAPDLVFASIEVKEPGMAVFEVWFHRGTRLSDITNAQFQLDIDQNPLTGGQSDGLGLEYIVNVGSLAYPNAELQRWVSGNGYSRVLTAPVNSLGDGLQFVIPLTGIDEGRMDFRVSASVLLDFVGVGGRNAFSGVLDVMPNRDLPPGTVR